MLDHLGWVIQKPTRMTIVVADGYKATPLGKVEEVPIKFGPIIIIMNMVIVNTTTYDAILGNDFLTKA